VLGVSENVEIKENMEENKRILKILKEIDPSFSENNKIIKIDFNQIQRKNKEKINRISIKYKNIKFIMEIDTFDIILRIYKGKNIIIHELIPIKYLLYKDDFNEDIEYLKMENPNEINKIKKDILMRETRELLTLLKYKEIEKLGKNIYKMNSKKLLMRILKWIFPYNEFKFI
jgi:hypothetical protein